MRNRKFLCCVLTRARNMLASSWTLNGMHEYCNLHTIIVINQLINAIIVLVITWCVEF